MKHPLIIRLQHAWAVLTGRVILPQTPEIMELEQAMSALDDALARLNAAAARAIAKGQADSAAAASAAATAADLEARTVNNLTAVADSLDAYSPPVLDLADPAPEA